MHTIRSRPWTFFTGSVPDGRQVLLGWVWDFVGVLFFDQAGQLVETSECPHGVDLSHGFGPVVEVKVAKAIRLLKRGLRFRKSAIHVKPFAIKSWDVALRPFPLHLEEFLACPDRFSEEDAAYYRRDVRQWEADQRCVLKWGNDHFLDRDGNTI
jgi:hypothetical protein